MRSRTTWLVAAAALALPLVGVFAAPLPQRPAAVAGAEFIRTTQQEDGGFGGFGPGQTMDAIFAIRAAGLDPNTFAQSGHTPADYLRSVAADTTGTGAAAKAALAAKALGLDPRNVAGTDLVAVTTAAYDPATGQYAEDVFTHALAMISLARLGMAAPTEAIVFLRESQLADGGWGFEGASDPDTTALAIQALVDAGRHAEDPDVAEGVAYLRSTQGNDGGWGFDPAESNTSSTAFAVQALLAAGEDPAEWDVEGADPIDYLLSQQRTDGSFAGFDPAFATNQVIPALAGRTFGGAVDTPILPAPAPRQVAPGPPDTGTGVAKPGDGEFPAVVAGVVLASIAALAVTRLRSRER